MKEQEFITQWRMSLLAGLLVAFLVLAAQGLSETIVLLLRKILENNSDPPIKLLSLIVSMLITFVIYSAFIHKFSKEAKDERAKE